MPVAKMGIYGVWLYEVPACWNKDKCTPFPPRESKLMTMTGTSRYATRKDIEGFIESHKEMIAEIKFRGKVAVVMGGKGAKCILAVP